MIRPARLFLFSLLLFLIAFSLPMPLAAQDDALPDVVVAARADFFPEGVEYDADGGRFLTGSLTEGTIFAVSDDGMVTPFIEDADLSATVGIHIDKMNNRLLVANTNNPAASSETPVASLGIYDLVSGDRLALVDFVSLLPDVMHFPNDVTSDSDGNAYVSDSFAGVVYKVDADGNAEIFAQGDLLTAQGFGPNGIEVVNDEFLLLAVTANATLIKIPLDDPTNMSEVALPEALGGDGLLLHPNGDLLMVAPSPDGNELIALRSDDNWESATIVDRQPAPGATTAALRGDAVYAVNAHLGELFGDGASVAAFEINRIDLALDAAAASAGDAANGQSLFVTNCSVCHNADSEATLVGPGLLGISERAATRVEGLSAEAYIRQSILEPGAFVVEGFPPAMPATFGAMFTDEQIDDLVAYLKSL